MNTQRFKSLSARQKVLVAIAVLLDGREAGTYLESDSINGEGLKKAALDIASMPPELRMPFVGTVLRAGLEKMGLDNGR